MPDDHMHEPFTTQYQRAAREVSWSEGMGLGLGLGLGGYGHVHGDGDGDGHGHGLRAGVWAAHRLGHPRV
jgi:hypothetical protein